MKRTTHYLHIPALAIAAWVITGLLAACATSSLSRQEREARAAAEVQQHINDMRFVIEVDMMYPLRGTSKHLDYGYEVKIQGDSLYSHLPYFGRAYNIPYGGGKGLSFAAPILEKTIGTDKKGRTVMQFYLRNDEDEFYYLIEVFSNGKSSVEVQSRQRERISFNGQMKLETQ